MAMLHEREIDVLRTIIEEYILNAQPVGSRAVARQSTLKLSPASMRNVMADLTDKGFLQQPHTSAGRIPTVSAFRYYIDTSLTPMPLSDEDAQHINTFLSQAGLELADILSQASKLVSGLSNQVSMVLAPSREDVRWREIGFALVKDGPPCLVMAILVLDGGIVQNRLIEFNEPISVDDLTGFSNYLNENFRGKTLSEARMRISQELSDAKLTLKELYRRALSLARSTFENIDEREVFVDGTSNMLDQTQDTDIGRMRKIMRLLEERSKLLDLLDKTIAEKGIKITLGYESEMTDLSDWGVISSSYGQGTPLGVVSVIGPVRMDYAKVVPVVDYIAKTLTHLLKHRF